jgi:DNA repair protein SbcD/Mre11
VRWQSPQVSLADSIGLEGLTSLLWQRTEQLLAEQPCVAHLVSWKIECRPALRTAIRRSDLATKLLGSCRTEFGHRSPPCWTVAIKVQWPQEIPPAWNDEDTIRGDFLRELRDLENSVEASSIEDIYQHFSGSWNETITSAEHPQIQCDAAWLGADLLSPQEAAS